MCVSWLLLVQTELGCLLFHFAQSCGFIAVTDKAGADRERGLICVDTYCYRLNVCFRVHECIPACVSVYALLSGATCVSLLHGTYIPPLFLEYTKRQSDWAWSIQPSLSFITTDFVHNKPHHILPQGNLRRPNRRCSSLGLNQSIFLSQVVPCPEISGKGPAQDAVLRGQEEISGNRKEI